MSIRDKSNEYAKLVGAIRAPKTVWMAIAASLANQVNGGSLDRGTAPIDTLMAEWQTLYDNGIVAQRPRRPNINKRATNKPTSICVVDFDEARYLGSEEDGVYYQVAQGPDGWYVSTVVDCNSSSFTDALITDDGPYATEAEAWQAGKHGAADWCIDNQVAYDEAEA